MWTFHRLERFFRDVAYALRALRKNPAFAVAAVLTLALGIGGNAAMFTIVRGVLLKPLDYRDPDRLVELSMENDRNLRTFTPVRYEELRTKARSFEAIGAFGLPENMTMSAGPESQPVSVARVSANFVRILGVNPVLGRRFFQEEDRPGGRPVAMIGERLWRQVFSRDARAAGKTVTLDSAPYTVIGVLPSNFHFPFSGVDIWLTRPSEWCIVPPESRARTASIVCFARLKSRTGIEQANAELDVLNHQYIAAHAGMPDAAPGATMRISRLADELVANVRAMLRMLSGCVGFVLLIACANVANIILARSAVRGREFAIRTALGAARGRLIAQLLAESLVLALLGGAVGLCLADGLLKVVTRMSAFDLPRSWQIQLDGGVLTFTAMLSLATVAVFGLLPALRISRPGLADALRERVEGSGPASAGPGWLGSRLTTRGLLVTGQVALSLVLLIGAALLMKSFVRLHNVNPGFQPANLLMAQIPLPAARYDKGQKMSGFFETLLSRVEAVPGVRGAAVARTLPTMPYQLIALHVAEQPPVNFTERPSGQLQTVTGDYFHTLGIPLRKGRLFTDRDLKDGPPVLIVNEALARRFWRDYPQGASPIGQHIQLGASSWPIEIVGIAADVHEASLSADVVPEVYLPARLSPAPTGYLVVRTEGDPLRFVNTVRSQVSAIDREQAISAVRTIDDLIDASLGRQRLTMLLLNLFAGVALLLAVVGLYGSIAYSVAQRTHEVGIRRALGAQHSGILRLVVGEGLGMTLAGVALGVAAASILSRIMKAFLFQVSATDPWAFAGMAILLILVALAASYIPAQRATQVDPMATLR
ncbi:MAG: ABC transporter permease [Bryobacteraceae bacterium]|jgi:predicted permease